MKLQTKLWIGLVLLVLLTPLGLIATGTAWGEWSADGLLSRLGSIPAGFERLESLWKAAIPDYSFPGWDEGYCASIGYIISAIVGVGVVLLVAFVFGKFLTKKK